MELVEIQILKLFASKDNYTSSFFEKKFNLSKGQLNYRIKKINQELALVHLKKIRKKGSFFLLTEKWKAVDQYLAKVSPIIHLSDKERMAYLYLAVLLHQRETLQSLAQKLLVSKNTILKDKKKLQNSVLAPLDIDIHFSRKKGFYLEGNEVEIRKLGIKYIREVKKKGASWDSYLAIIEIDYGVLSQLKEQMYLLEGRLGLEFTELKLFDLCLTVYMCVCRFQQGKVLSSGSLGNYVEMVEKDFYTKISQALAAFFGRRDSLIEIHFIAVQLLSTNLIKIRSTYKDQKLLEKIRSFIFSFELLGITAVKNKAQLEAELYQHIIPAYYRIKFGLPDTELLSMENVENYDYIYPIVHQSINIIESYLDIVFPEGELIYISIILLSFINEELEKKKQQRIRAVVVCQHGVSVSKLLLGELKSLFSSYQFVSNLSLREFYEKDMEAIDLVFSTVPVKTKKEVFRINHFLTDEDKLELQNEVRKRVDFDPSVRLSKDRILVQNVINIVKKNTRIIDENKLTRELQEYVLTSEVKLNCQVQSPDLVDLLPLSHIQIYSKVKMVDEAIRIASKPLVNQGFVSQKYVEKVIESYDPEFPYAVISPDLAIPHASPDDGVYRVGMSLLKLDRPIQFAKEIFISIIVVIAPKDKKSHIKAVTHLYELAKDPTFIQKIRQAKYEKDIRQSIKLEALEKR